MFKIYTYKNFDFQISFCEKTKNYEILDLKGYNFFGCGKFKNLNSALNDIKLYIDLIK